MTRRRPMPRWYGSLRRNAWLRSDRANTSGFYVSRRFQGFTYGR